MVDRAELDRQLVEAYNAGAPLDEIAAARGIRSGSVKVSAQRAARRIGATLQRPRTPQSRAPDPAWFRDGPGGPARMALDAALNGLDLSGFDGITAEIARGAADLVDSARRQQDPRLWLSASQRLLVLVSQLSDGRGSAVPDDGGGDRDDDGEPDPLADALGAGPTMGDEPEP